VLARAGVAMGVIEASVHTLVGRKISDARFDRSPIGLRRWRSIVNGLLRLEADPPRYASGTPDLAVIATVVAPSSELGHGSPAHQRVVSVPRDSCRRSARGRTGTAQE